MPDNWGFVAAAYGLTALVLGIYWRRLVRREKALSDPSKSGSTRSRAGSATSVAGTAPSVGGTAPSVAERSPNPSRPAHPRRKPDTTSSLP